MIYCVEDDSNIRELVVYTLESQDESLWISRWDCIYESFGI